jgi:hypothetical protein
MGARAWNAIRLGAVAAAVAAAGCLNGPQLAPAWSANVVPGAPSVAFQEVSGVMLTVEAGAWPRDGAALAPGVTALYVTMQNGGERPLLLSRRAFALQGASGRRYPALPPPGVAVRDGDRDQTVVQPVFGDADPAAGGLRPLPAGPQPMPQVSPRETSFPYGPGLEFRARAVPAEALRRQPVARALPEGTLARGEAAAGFVYFDSAAVASERRLLFEATVVEAEAVDAVRVARATIPLRVEGAASHFSR